VHDDSPQDEMAPGPMLPGMKYYIKLQYSQNLRMNSHLAVRLGAWRHSQSDRHWLQYAACSEAELNQSV